jgi:anti-sigma factor RsiW
MHEQASPLLEAYVLDALEPDETAVVDAHLDEGCVDCENDVGVLRQLIGLIPLGAPLYEAGASLKQRVFHAIEEPDPAEKERAPVRQPGFLASVRRWLRG